MEQKFIRNFCIIAHIDHGKSTLADRLLEYTGTISARDMTVQFLDQMDLERERGITIKAQSIRIKYMAKDGHEYELNLIDTPGHVDFAYEVSRSLAACEGALLVVDATQGIQAQTLANVYMALDRNLTIIPIVNKIDLPAADPERVAKELVDTLGFDEKDIIPASAKVGTGTQEILEAIVNFVPPPSGSNDKPLRALIFDSKYDAYKGVIVYVRLFDGTLSAGRKIKLMSTGLSIETLEVGVFRPKLVPLERLDAGEVGYIATGLKNVRECRVGDTITLEDTPAAEALAGYQAQKPMVYCGLYPVEGSDYPLLRDSLDKLKLNDAAIVFEPETSAALGSGFRCGFLGLLHMDIVQERLEREYNLNIIMTSPSVAYIITKVGGEQIMVDNPADFPSAEQIEEVKEPWLDATIIAPSRYIGAIMDLVTSSRGEYVKMEYLDSKPAQVGDRENSEPAKDPRVLLVYKVPLAEVLVDFYDKLKSRTQGYASLDYNVTDHRPSELVKLDILVNGVPVDALSRISHKSDAYQQGKALVEKLKELIPRQLFDAPIQAAIGSKIIARETVKAKRKDVLAKCYGGDVTRKRKLLEKQAEGKKRMKMVGSVEIPQEAFLAVLKMERE